MAYKNDNGMIDLTKDSVIKTRPDSEPIDKRTDAGILLEALCYLPFIVIGLVIQPARSLWTLWEQGAQLQAAELSLPLIALVLVSFRDARRRKLSLTTVIFFGLSILSLIILNSILPYTFL